MLKAGFIALVLLILIGLGGLLVSRSKAAPDSTQHPAAVHTPATAAAPSFDKKQYSLTNPASIWVVVNKQRPLQPDNYVPADLVVPGIALRSNITGDEKQVRQPVAAALSQLFTAAASDGVTLNLQSGYRSYDLQVNVYGGYVRTQGQATADSQSARPGYSEHQTGLAADIGGITNPSCNVALCFKDTPEAKWLSANAYKYGFIVRYPADKTSVTGYAYEPWHVRFIGTALSNELHRTSTETLEEFFNLGAAPGYK